MITNPIMLVPTPHTLTTLVPCRLINYALIQKRQAPTMLEHN